jgi:hypothetical protein
LLGVVCVVGGRCRWRMREVTVKKEGGDCEEGERWLSRRREVNVKKEGGAGEEGGRWLWRRREVNVRKRLLEGRGVDDEVRLSDVSLWGWGRDWGKWSRPACLSTSLLSFPKFSQTPFFYGICIDAHRGIQIDSEFWIQKHVNGKGMEGRVYLLKPFIKVTTY